LPNLAQGAIRRAKQLHDIWIGPKNHLDGDARWVFRPSHQ